MPSEEISALRAFLEYGPIGLAGLMLILTIIAMSVRDLSDSRAGLLKFFLSIGGACFGLTLLFEYMRIDGEHELILFVAPHDVKENLNDFPPPDFNVNGEQVDRKKAIIIKSDSQVRVDVSEAFSLFSVSSAQVADQETEIVAQQALLKEREAALAEKSLQLADQELQLQEQSERIERQRKSIQVQRSELNRREEAMVDAQAALEDISNQIEVVKRNAQAVPIPEELLNQLQRDVLQPTLSLRP